MGQQIESASLAAVAMRTMKKKLIIGMAVLACASPALADVPTTYASKDHLDIISSGSGVVIGPHEVLTANHVADSCRAINVFGKDAYVAAHDETNDLAVVHTKDQWATWALFSNLPVHAGDTAIAMGYPLAGVLADAANVTVGNVSALAGLLNDSRFLQITTPVQPGNSGGGLFDSNGGIIGIVQGRLDVAKFLKYFGDIPQNVNFAIKAEQARAFLDSNGVKYQAAPNLGRILPATEVATMARPFTVRIDCYGEQEQAKPESPPPQQRTTPPPQQPPPAPSPSVSDAPKRPFRIVNASDGYLNLRSGPGTSFEQIASIPVGSTVLVGRCVKPEGLLPFCEVEWQGKSGWASSCCMAESFSYLVTQNLNLRSAPDRNSRNVLSDYAPKDYIPEGTSFTWTNRPDGSNCTVGSGAEIWCRLSYDHDGITSQGWVSAHFLRSKTDQMLLACLFPNPDPNCYPQQVLEGSKDDKAPLTKPKNPDRVGQPSSSDQVAPVAQRVVLYDEDPRDPKGKQYVGSVIWRTEPVRASANKKADIAVRADIEIPDRKFKMTMSFRRNTDTSLPASHTVEFTFILPPDFAGGGVSNVPGILMKSDEQARGKPLAGLTVKVTDGFFLAGLSNVDADRARNIQLVKQRSWFDVPMVYVNQRRAFLAIEKGPSGEQAFANAFSAWEETYAHSP
jgi:hypothetical protein